VNVPAIVVIVLSGPAGTLVVFAGLAMAALTTYAFSGASHSATPRWEARPGSDLADMPWWKVQRRLWQRVETPRAVTARLLGPGLAVAAAALVGLIASYLVLLPLSTAAILTGNSIPPDMPFPRLVGGALGLLSLQKCLRYLAGRAPTHGRLHAALRGPALRLADRSLSLHERRDFNRKVYLYIHLRWAAVVAGFASPVLFIVGFTTIPVAPPSATPASSTTAFVVALLAVTVALSFLVASRLGLIVTLMLPAVHAAIAVHRCLPDSPDLPYQTHVGWSRDPLAGKRRPLHEAALALTRAAARIDRAAPQHPIASVIFACAREIRAFLSSVAALSAQYPSRLDTTLTDALIVLAAPADPERTITLGARLGAFDDGGQPSSGLRQPLERPWVLLVERAGNSLEPYARIGSYVWGLISLILVAILIATGKLDPTKFQLQK
jgi:hypothetical protein